MSPATGAPPPATPEWAGALPGGSQGRRWPPTPPTSTSPHDHHHMEIHSPLCTLEWIEWCARYVQTPSWWEELTKIPSHADHKEFAQKVCASFEVPKACNWVKRWTTTTCSYQHTPPLESTISCHPRMRVSVPRTSSLPSCNIPSPMQGLCSIGSRWCIPQSPANQLPGKECTGAPVGNGAAHHFHRRRCLCDHGAVKIE